MQRASLSSIVAGAVLLAHAGAARADDPPSAHAAEEFEAQGAAPTSTAPTVRDTRLRLQAGASLATGNTQSFAGNLATRFLLRRGMHQFTFDGVMNYGRASVLPMGAPSDSMRTDTTTAENYLARARYDAFLTDNNGLFLSAQAFRDQPSGFNSRFSGQLGYLRNFINVPARRRFWGEVGFDATYENLTVADAHGRIERFVPSARLFLGFEEKASSVLELNAGIEGLLNVSSLDPQDGPVDFRLNGTVGLASRITDDFSLALTLAAHYLSTPVPGHYGLDTTTLISVIFQRSLEPPPPPPPPAPPPPAASAPHGGAQ